MRIRDIWAKLITAMRGGVVEVGEAMVDSQALRILEQEIRDARQELGVSRTSLANIMARQRLADDKVAQLQTQETEYEQYALQALNKGDEALALDIAEKIRAYQLERTEVQSLSDHYVETVSRLRQSIQQAETQLLHMQQEVDQVKAIDSVQQAHASLARQHSGTQSRLSEAVESLSRIKARQRLQGAQLEAAEQLALEEQNTPLEAKIEAAGISSSLQAEDILQRLKAEAMEPGRIGYDGIRHLSVDDD